MSYLLLLIIAIIIIYAYHISKIPKKTQEREIPRTKEPKIEEIYIESDSAVENNSCSIESESDVIASDNVRALVLKGYDPLFVDIANEAVVKGQISTSYIQRNFEIGFNRAGRIMTQLERAGIIGPQIGVKPREIKFYDLQSLKEQLLNLPIISDSECIRYPDQYDEDLERAEIAAKIKERHRRRQLEKTVRQELIDSGELFGDQNKRPLIPREVVDAVYSRDGGRCVYCGSTENLQLDHIIPFSKGGATTLENLQLLCQKCNLEKSNKIG